MIHQRSGSGLRYLELPSDLITVPVLEELGNRCVNLRYLTLDFSNAMQLHDFNELLAFPSSLSYLCICLSDVIFMEGLMRKIYPCLSSIEVMHLIGEPRPRLHSHTISCLCANSGHRDLTKSPNETLTCIWVT
ncbi:unnamed protein product [Protopolystoma xenopodis]|uniref:F-box domain-containing protein n=1 Tax=Protopolystoma xenopodis TaxID=117903 RepID=A0A3S4ZSY6_9PLAT|nr:unnamed protein product [Protopolystoma xenopodis]